ncbi:MAG: N-acetyl-gamma-glutamyl-phosphate reductase, partial [Candidatus Saccharibacteria bacterium]
MIKVGIIGDGYTAADLIRLFAGHDQARVVAITSVDNIGKKFTDIYPHLTGFTDVVMEQTSIEGLQGHIDAAFLAVPHGQSVPLVKGLVEAGIKCIDLGADFRLQDTEVYKKHYHLEHKAPELLKQAVYGIPEFYREQIKQSPVVANPGCYPTGATFALAPLLRNGLIKEQGIIVDSKSGVTGAGRGPSLNTHFCEVNEGL